MSSKYRPNTIDAAEITPKEMYLSRRNFIRSTGLLAGSMVLGACVPAIKNESSPATLTSCGSLGING